MEAEVSKLTKKEIEEKLGELEHTYADSFGNNANVSDLHYIRKKILELQKELGSRSTE